MDSDGAGCQLMADMEGFRMPEPPLVDTFTAGDLAQRLVDGVVTQVTALEQSTAPGLVLPSLLGGHPVLDDAKADLAYVLGLLIECGVSEVGGINLADYIPELIATLTPAAVEGFYSYRVGETVLRLGGLQGLPDELHQHVLDAVDSPEIRRRLSEGGDIPPNFAIVATRCLEAGARLSGQDAPELDVFVDRARAMFETSNGWIDDGMAPWVHYDIYTPDLYLFADPIVDRIGPAWEQGLRQVLRDLDDVVSPGGAITWGRSIGALGLAITIELAAVGVGRDLLEGQAQGRWLSRAASTLDELQTWFPNGLIAAHQNRATMFYRGPARRLQMTLDIVGKLLLAAIELRSRPEVVAGNPADNWKPTDRLLRFAPDTNNAGLWAFRSPQLRFNLPLIFGFSTDYLPSLRSPGLFEPPTSGHPVLLPVISPGLANEMSGKSADPLVPSGLPIEVQHQEGQLTLTHHHWTKAGATADSEPIVRGTRTATYRVEGRSLVVTEQLRFDNAELPGPLTISIPETPDRPLLVEAEGDSVVARQRVDTSGLAEWRSFWGELPAVHQIELTPAPEVDFTWRVTPRLRVASTITGHQYDRSLYQHLTEELIAVAAGLPDAGLAQRLDSIDVLHMAWPEWWAGTDPSRNAAVLSVLARTGTRIVWTQHNLLPHLFKDDNAATSYQLWAEAADAMIHHTHVGMEAAKARYRYREDCTHHVINHGHWGGQYPDLTDSERADARKEVERREGWPEAEVRLAVVGAPRQEKRLQEVVDAVAASSRDDIQLIIRADASVSVPPDTRIIAEYDHLSEGRYESRMAAFDALVLPFESVGMLTTGTAFDCIGAGVAAITSNWNFFDETFDGNDIRYGESAEELSACIDSLTENQLQESRAGIVALSPRFEWADIAAATSTVLHEVADR